MDKVQEYKDYIEEHKNNVTEAWNKIKNLMTNGDYENFNIIPFIVDNLVVLHDKSKYSKEEFEPYRQKFHPNEGEIVDEELFEKAWQHHLSENMHHWQSMQRNEWKSMFTMEYTMEMICDWLAMAKKFNKSHRTYYEKNKDKIVLIDKQKELLEFVYGLLDEEE